MDTLVLYSPVPEQQLRQWPVPVAVRRYQRLLAGLQPDGLAAMAAEPWHAEAQEAQP